MTGRLWGMAMSAFAIGLLAGCSSSTATHPTSKPTPKPTPNAHAISTPVPAPSGPFAVAVTNSSRQGATYQVLLIDLSGNIVTRAVAKLPLIKPNQSIQPPLLSASNSLVYYLDGDTDIHSLSTSGSTTVVKSVAAGSKSILTFAVSPDDQRIAVALMNQDSDPTKSSGDGYVEDLADGNHHQSLWMNTAADSLRWPVGWHGSKLVDDIGQCGGYYGQSAGAQLPSACSYHVVDSNTGSRTATLCETPATQSASGSDYYSVDGLPTPAGVACAENAYQAGTSQQTLSWDDWSGTEHTFATSQQTTGPSSITVGNCSLDVTGSRMACGDNSSGALTLLTPDGKTHSLGRKYGILGWMDDGHLFVQVDPSTLGVVNVDSGALTSIPFDHADQVSMITTLPGSL